jgi:hypothetical protein
LVARTVSRKSTPYFPYGKLRGGEGKPRPVMP